MSITKRTIQAIHNPTAEQIAQFFNLDISDKYDNYERVLCVSKAVNLAIGMINYSIVTTCNKVNDCKCNKGFSWNVEII